MAVSLFCLPYARGSNKRTERYEQIAYVSIHSRVPTQAGLMGAWRNEFMCIEMDITARFNICIQPHCTLLDRNNIALSETIEGGVHSGPDASGTPDQQIRRGPAQP